VLLADEQPLTDAQRADRPGCRPPRLGPRDNVWQARLDGDRAVLVTGPATAGRVAATVYSCQGEPLATTSVRAP
jgi:hypothetical protein